jgi:NAD(P)H-hydrate epimerase
MKVVTAEEMRTLDRQATSDFGIPSVLLMENAARGVVDKVETIIGPVAGRHVVIVAGSGNNGGDGLAAARHLRMRGASVSVYLLGAPERVGGDAKTSLAIWQKSGGTLHPAGTFDWPHLEEALSQADLILDALFGTGLSRPVDGDAAEAIERINAVRRCPDVPKGRPEAANATKKRGRIVSIDIPSGISSDTGEAWGRAIRADDTIALALPKRGHFVDAGLEHAGRLEVVDIGIPPQLVERLGLQTALIVPRLHAALFAPRPHGAHKGTMGHLLVVAGSDEKSGAAAMTCSAALRTGCGLVTCAWPASVTRSLPVEVMTLPLPATRGALSAAAWAPLQAAMVGKHAIAIGPGLAVEDETQALVRRLIAEVSIPMVVDADGLNALASDLSILKRRHGPLILTPHPGEMARLLGTSSEAVQKRRFDVASDFAKEWNVIVVLKGAHTLVAAPDGSIAINTTGNPGMATAGTGDVLTGVISSLLAQDLAPWDAARLGVYLHGLSGDLAARACGEVGLIASDLIERLPEAITDRHL